MYIVQFVYVSLRENKALEETHTFLQSFYSAPSPRLPIIIATMYDLYLVRIPPPPGIWDHTVYEGAIGQP
jgi:hypothetical protein